MYKYIITHLNKKNWTHTPIISNSKLAKKTNCQQIYKNNLHPLIGRRLNCSGRCAQKTYMRAWENIKTDTRAGVHKIHLKHQLSVQSQGTVLSPVHVNVFLK